MKKKKKRFFYSIWHMLLFTILLHKDLCKDLWQFLVFTAQHKSLNSPFPHHDYEGRQELQELWFHKI